MYSLSHCYRNQHHYVLRSSRISWKSRALIVRYSQKKECISIVLRILQLLITLEPTGPIQVGFSAKMYLSKWALPSNGKLKMSHVWVPTDFSRLQYICVAGSVGSQQYWLWDIARRRNEFLLFSFVLRIPQLLIILETTGPIQVGFSEKCTSPNEHFN